MSNQIYDNLKKGLLNGSIDLLVDDIYVLLVQEYNTEVTTSATTLSGTMSFEYSGTTGLELSETSGVNYTSGGYALTNKAVSGSDGTFFFDADDITISGGTPEDTSITAGGMLLYKRLTPIETSIPLAYFDLGTDNVTLNSPYIIQWYSTGILSMETKE